MSYLRSLPLLGFPMLFYNIIVLANPVTPEQTSACIASMDGNVHPIVCVLNKPIVHVPMRTYLEPLEGEEPRLVTWAVSVGDALLVFALVCLFAELLNSTSSGSWSLVNHGLSLLLFVAGLVEFLLYPAFATSAFFLICLMTVLDVLAGFIVSITAARRDLNVVN